MLTYPEKLSSLGNSSVTTYYLHLARLSIYINKNTISRHQTECRPQELQLPISSNIPKVLVTLKENKYNVCVSM